MLFLLLALPALALDLHLSAQFTDQPETRLVLQDLADGDRRSLLLDLPSGPRQVDILVQRPDERSVTLSFELADLVADRKGRLTRTVLSSPRVTTRIGTEARVAHGVRLPVFEEGKVRFFERVLSLTLLPIEPGSPMTVDLDRLLDFSDPAGSEAAYRALLPQAADEPARLALLTRVARCRGLQKDYEGALAQLAEVEAGLAALPEAHEAWIRLHLERGRVHNSSGDAPGALPHFQAAMERAEGKDQEGLRLDAMHMLAIASPAEQALAWGLRAIEQAEGSADPAARRWLGPLYNNTGWTLMDLGRPAEALPLFERGLAVRQARSEVKPTLIARWTVARAWRELGRCEEALVELRALQQAWAELGEEDPYVTEEILACGG